MCLHVHMFIVLLFLFPLSELGVMLWGWVRFISTFARCSLFFLFLFIMLHECMVQSESSVFIFHNDAFHRVPFSGVVLRRSWVHLFIMGVPKYWSLFHFITENHVQQLRILCFYLALELHVPLLLRLLKSIIFLFYWEQCHGLEQSLKRHPSASILLHLLLGHLNILANPLIFDACNSKLLQNILKYCSLLASAISLCLPRNNFS